MDELIPYEKFKDKLNEKKDSSEKDNTKAGKIINLEEFKNEKTKEALRVIFGLPKDASDEKLMDAIELKGREMIGFPPDWTEEEIMEALRRLEQREDNDKPEENKYNKE